MLLLEYFDESMCTLPSNYFDKKMWKKNHTPLIWCITFNEHFSKIWKTHFLKNPIDDDYMTSAVAEIFISWHNNESVLRHQSWATCEIIPSCTPW